VPFVAGHLRCLLSLTGTESPATQENASGKGAGVLMYRHCPPIQPTHAIVPRQDNRPLLQCQTLWPDMATSPLPRVPWSMSRCPPLFPWSRSSGRTARRGCCWEEDWRGAAHLKDSPPRRGGAARRRRERTVQRRRGERAERRRERCQDGDVGEGGQRGKSGIVGCKSDGRRAFTS
jgi:hypothetical protein